MQSEFYLGIDFGTSGARAIAIDPQASIVAEAKFRFPATDATGLAELWRTALFSLIAQISLEVRQQVKAIAINGTSSTVLICDRQGTPLDVPLLYNDARGAAVIEKVQAIAPPNHTVVSATSSLTKLLWWHQKFQQQPSRSGYFLHQADWLAFLLHGQIGISDYHNALKLGYDVGSLRYPDWLQQLATPFKLPHIVAPGTPIDLILPDVGDRFGFPTDCLICAGTTDSIAAFLASGAQSPGEAVTSLGSTLVLKLLSPTRIDEAHYGIYSHRLGQLWLVGGASNTGGAVLQQFFSTAELQHYSQQITPNIASPLDYYPLLKAGERFPINDPNLQPRLEPRPENPAEFLHGLLESIAKIEAQAYQLLQTLGAPPLTQVYTAGGGANNETWTQMRSRHLQVPVKPSEQTEAAFGTALLARGGGQVPSPAKVFGE